MKVNKFMSSQVQSISQDASYVEAMEKMEKNKIRHLLVMSGEKLAGIITLTDLYRVSPSPATALSNYELLYLLDKLKVKQIMTSKLEVTSPETSIQAAARKMLDNSISCLPVIKDNKLVGIITETDLLRAILEVSEEQSE